MEAFAYRLIQLEQPFVQLISLIIMFGGGWLAATRTNFTFKIGRSGYFLSYGFVVFLGALTSVFAFGIYDAIKQNYLIAIVILVYGSLIPVGAIAGVFAAARSRDAYGYSQRWFYAFVPFLNLALIFKGTREALPTSAVSKFQSFVIVVLGMVLTLAGFGINRAAEEVVAKSLSSALNDPILVEKASQYEIANDGIEAFLTVVANGITVPVKVDSVTTLKKVEVKGDTLRYVYDVSEQNAKFDGSWHDLMMSRWCKNDGFIKLMRVGATLEGSYLDEAGNQLGIVKSNLMLCDDWKQQFNLVMENSARAVKGPTKLDDLTTLEGATYVDPVFSYNYTLSQPITDQTVFHDYLDKQICSSNFTPMYKNDITVKFVYHSTDGGVVAEVTGDKAKCLNGN